MYVISILAPLLNFGSLLFFGRYLNRIGGCMIALVWMALAVISTLLALYEVGFCYEICEVKIIDWVFIGNLKIELGFLFDTLTVIMMFTVCFISLLIHIYSVKYMEEDPNQIRYMGYLSFFTFCMLILVTADNFIQMFIGWEGVGISSYLLISFWYTRILANKAAMKAMFINRIGDICLLIALSSIILFFGSVNYIVVEGIINYYIGEFFKLTVYKINLIDFISLFLFLGAMGKSAQLFLHVWLPSAMEGPTPVSALIHAATMVTAGVFLVIRCSFIFELSDIILLFIVFIGSLTCFFMGVIGIYQNDIKRIVAYSTCSQLGYMFFACGLSNYYVSIFHLFNHAFFKALLFLSMGSIIHAALDEQDLRKLGASLKFLPITAICVFFGTLALLGIPFLAGYYSKDLLLEISFMRHIFDGYFSFTLGILAVFCTAFYSTRLFFRVFLSKSTAMRGTFENIHESSFLMVFPMIVLVILSIFIGFIFSEAFMGLGSNFWGNSIFIKSMHYNMLDVEFNLPIFVRLIPLVFTLVGIGLYFILSEINVFKSSIYRIVYKFFSNEMLFDKIYNIGILYKFLSFSYNWYYRYIEFGIFQIFFITTLKNLSLKLYKGFKQILLGKFYLYIAFIILGILYLNGFLMVHVYFNIPFEIISLSLSCFFLRPFIGWSSNKWIFLQLIIKEKKYSFARYKWKS